MTYRLRIKNLSQLVTVSNDHKPYKIRDDMKQLNIINNGTIIINDRGLIEDLGPTEQLAEKYAKATFAQDIDGTGKSVIPGFVDAHTHPVWSGDRVHEFVMKLSGVPYLEIHKAGGGIGFTVDHTTRSSEEELEKLLRSRLQRMLRNGSTLIEAKSGYGLKLDTELKMLRVLHKLSLEGPVEIVSTYLGAHSVPKGSNADDATRDIVENQIPKIKALKQGGDLSVENIDVFLEEGVFNYDQTKKILKAGQEAGLQINFHGDEIHPMNSGELGGELSALAISHLEKVSEEGIKAMAIKPTFAVLLPTTAYLLRLTPPPARKFIEAGVPVALGSDYNPNAHCLSMPFVMNLSCVLFHMTPNEALVAATLNAAGSLNRGESHGSLEIGKVGDLIIIDHANWEHIIYEMVDPPLHSVVKNGHVVFSNPLL